MFNIGKNEKGDYILNKIKNKDSNFNGLNFVTCKNEKSFKIFRKGKRFNPSLTFRFIDQSFVMYRQNTSEYRDLINNLIKIHTHIQIQFGFDIVALLNEFEGKINQIILIKGFRVLNKKNTALPVNLEIHPNEKIVLESTVHLKKSKYKVPKLLNKFLKEDIYSLYFPLTNNHRYVRADKLDYVVGSAPYKLTESIKNLSELNQQNENQNSIKIDTTLEKDILDISIIIDRKIDPEYWAAPKSMNDFFSLEMALMQRILDCYQNNTARLKDVKLMTEKQFKTHLAEQERLEKQTEEVSML